MKEPGAKPRRRRRALVAGLVLIVIAIAAALYLRSDAFADRVRRRVISEIEADTGGKAEVKSFTWNLSRLEFILNDVTLHGREAPGQVPYAHADRIIVRLKVLSFLSRTVALRYMSVEHPVIHLIVYPDGSTNQPAPQSRSQVVSASVQAIFALSVGHVELHSGQVFWNDQPIPFEITGNDMSGTLDYLPAERRYRAKLDIAHLDATIAQYRPLHGREELELLVGHDAADIKALHVETARSKLDASGRVTGYNDPQVELTYRFEIAADELGDFARLTQVRGGEIIANGHGHYSFKDFASAGRIFLRGFSWRGAGVCACGLNGAADYSLTPREIRLTHIAGSAFGGSVTGDGMIRDWLQSLNPDLHQPEEQGAFHLALRDAQVASLATAVATKQFPLDRMDLAGRAGGSINVEWRGSPEFASTEAVLDLEPPAQPRPNELPVTGHIESTYSAREARLTVKQLSIATRGTTLNATGELGSKTGRVTFALNTTDLTALRPVLAALHETAPLPVELDGRASFTGALSGRLHAPVLEGHLEVTDFDTVYRAPLPSASVMTASAPPTAQAPERRAHWDLFRGDVTYAPDQLTLRNGLLRQGNASAELSGTMKVSGGALDLNAPFEVHAHITGTRFRDVQALAGSQLPIDGDLRLTLDVSGTRSNLTGTGDVTLSNGLLYNEPFQSLTASLRFLGTEVQANELVLRHNGAQVTGKAAYAPSTRAFRLDLTGDGFDLARIQQLQTSRFNVAGTTGFHMLGAGTLDAPVLSGHIAVRDLVINGEQVGALDADARTQGADLQLTARSHFQEAELTAQGTVHLRGDYPADLKLHFSQFDIDPLLRAYLGDRVTGHSTMAGTVTLKGPLAQPRLLTVDAQVDQFAAEIEHVHVASQGPIRFSMADQVLHLERMQLVGEGTDLSGYGTLHLDEPRALDVTLDGHANLTLLQTLNPDLTSSGDTLIDLHIGGTMAKPDMTGQLQIRNAGISFVDLPNGLSDVNGTLAFDQNRLRVQSLTAHSGGGTLSLGGFVSYAHGLYFDLTATSNDIRLRYPPGVSAVGNANLHLQGTTANSLLSGDITVTKFGLNPRFDFANYLARAKQPTMTQPMYSPLNNMRLDVHIVSTPELQVETALAKVTGNADLHLRGTATRPVVLGRVTIVQGDVSFAGTQYHVETGDIIFTNPVKIEPVLNIDATARVRDYDVTLGFHGPMDHLLTTYRSDPPLPTADIIALLAMGRTTQEVVLSQQQSTPNVTENASSAILGEALNATVSSRVQRIFGISRVKIDPQVGGAEGNPNARLTIEEDVSNHVTLTYITNLSQSAQQVIQVEYNVNRNVSILGVRDEFGVVAFTVTYRQRIR